MFNCPACGAQTDSNIQFTKLAVCTHCGNILFLEDEAVRNAGIKSAIIEVPSLFSLGQHYRYRSMSFVPVGRIQFDYGDGLWDEWWVITDQGSGKWISVDEGEIAIETRVEKKINLPDCKALKPGNKIKLLEQSLIITEVDEATCVAVAGELPEIIMPGEKHQYAHLSGQQDLLYTLECFDGVKHLYKGTWIDAFDIEAL